MQVVVILYCLGSNKKNESVPVVYRHSLFFWIKYFQSAVSWLCRCWTCGIGGLTVRANGTESGVKRYEHEFQLCYDVTSPSHGFLRPPELVAIVQNKDAEAALSRNCLMQISIKQTQQYLDELFQTHLDNVLKDSRKFLWSTKFFYLQLL